MILVKSTKSLGGQDSQGRRMLLLSLECDSEADLPSPDYFASSANAIISMGSDAHTIAENAKYMLNSSGFWVLQEAGTAAYTKAEVDALLAQKQGLLTFDAAPAADSTNPVYSGGLYTYIYGLPVTEIPQNADLNTATYIVPGVFRCSTNAIAETLSNCPTSNGFRMIVFDTIALTGYQQRIIYPNNANGEFFMQRRTTSLNFGSWFRFQGTAV